MTSYIVNRELAVYTNNRLSSQLLFSLLPFSSLHPRVKCKSRFSRLNYAQNGATPFEFYFTTAGRVFYVSNIDNYMGLGLLSHAPSSLLYGKLDSIIENQPIEMPLTAILVLVHHAQTAAAIVDQDHVASTSLTSS